MMPIPPLNMDLLTKENPDTKRYSLQSQAMRPTRKVGPEASRRRRSSASLGRQDTGANPGVGKKENGEARLQGRPNKQIEPPKPALERAKTDPGVPKATPRGPLPAGLNDRDTLPSQRRNATPAASFDEKRIPSRHSPGARAVRRKKTGMFNPAQEAGVASRQPVPQDEGGACLSSTHELGDSGPETAIPAAGLLQPKPSTASSRSPHLQSKWTHRRNKTTISDLLSKHAIAHDTSTPYPSSTARTAPPPLNYPFSLDSFGFGPGPVEYSSASSTHTAISAPHSKPPSHKRNTSSSSSSDPTKLAGPGHRRTASAGSTSLPSDAKTDLQRNPDALSTLPDGCTTAEHTQASADPDPDRNPWHSFAHANSPHPPAPLDPPAKHVRFASHASYAPSLHYKTPSSSSTSSNPSNPLLNTPEFRFLARIPSADGEYEDPLHDADADKHDEAVRDKLHQAAANARLNARGRTRLRLRRRAYSGGLAGKRFEEEEQAGESMQVKWRFAQSRQERPAAGELDRGFRFPLLTRGEEEEGEGSQESAAAPPLGTTATATATGKHKRSRSGSLGRVLRALSLSGDVKGGPHPQGKSGVSSGSGSNGDEREARGDGRGHRRSKSLGARVNGVLRGVFGKGGQ